MPALKTTLRKLAPPIATLLLCTAALASTLTGTVTNRTTGKPSAGDTIAVINTTAGMDEIVKATSTASGAFHVVVPDGGQILLHITHAGADYFKSVPPNTNTVAIDVYDSAAKIEGIAGEALVLRAETDPSGKTLAVAENFFVNNSSAPPRTQYGGNTFDFYLPKGAEITQTLANAPGGLPTTTEVKPIDTASGHYAFTFPIRPGETRFQVAYTLPYTGRLPFALKLSVPTGDVAVMLPKSMQFEGATAFQPISPDPATQTFDAHEPSFAQPVQFTLAGTGQLPQTEGSQGNAQQSNAGQTSASSDTRPGGGLGTPIDPEGTNDPWSKYKWWVIGLLGLALAGGAGMMLKSGPPSQPLPATGPAHSSPPAFSDDDPTTADIANSGIPPFISDPTPLSPSNHLLRVLKDELFELETDHLAGRLTDAQYAEHKAAFDLVLRRALSRIEPAPTASNS